jgi:hypothetical protein
MRTWSDANVVRHPGMVAPSSPKTVPPGVFPAVGGARPGVSLYRRRALEPAQRVLGTSREKCPKPRISAHIASYSSGSPLSRQCPKPPQMPIVVGRGSRVTLAIAMQKVVGSNPISRFFPANQRLPSRDKSLGWRVFDRVLGT